MKGSSRSVVHTLGCSASPKLCKPCLTQGGRHGKTSSELATPKRLVRVSVPGRISVRKNAGETLCR